MSRPLEEISNSTDNKALKLAEKLIKKKKKTWNDFIQFSGINRQVVRLWMLGQKSPSINSWNQISLFTENSIFEFLELTEFDLTRENDLFESNISERIKKANLSDVDIYRSGEINRRTVQRAKQKGSLPRYETLLKFQKFFNLKSVTELLDSKS